MARGTLAEKIVINDLERTGHTITDYNTKAPGSTDIETMYGYEKRLYQVKSATFPNIPYLSSDEKRNINSRASRIGATAYFAKVQFYEDQFGNLTYDNPTYEEL